MLTLDIKIMDCFPHKVKKNIIHELRHKHRSLQEQSIEDQLAIKQLTTLLTTNNTVLLDNPESHDNLTLKAFQTNTNHEPFNLYHNDGYLILSFFIQVPIVENDSAYEALPVIYQLCPISEDLWLSICQNIKNHLHAESLSSLPSRQSGQIASCTYYKHKIEQPSSEQDSTVPDGYYSYLLDAGLIKP